LNADPDPDPIRIRGVDDQNLGKKSAAGKIYFDKKIASIKDVQAT
jgi:hypothetical protein